MSVFNFNLFVCLLILINKNRANDIKNWYLGSPNLNNIYRNGVECIIYGYNYDTKYGYFIGGTNTIISDKPCNNNDFENIYRFKLDTRTSSGSWNTISMTNIKRIKKLNKQIYGCNPKSIQLNNKIYFINNNLHNYDNELIISMFDMNINKERYYEYYMNGPNDECTRMSPCWAADNNRNNIYMVCGKKFYYYEFKKNKWTRGSNLNYNHFESSCAYANNKFYVFAGNSTSTTEYVNIGNNIKKNRFNVLISCILEIKGIVLKNS